jgi:hypothetical protein
VALTSRARVAQPHAAAPSAKRTSTDSGNRRQHDEADDSAGRDDEPAADDKSDDKSENKNDDKNDDKSGGGDRSDDDKGGKGKGGKDKGEKDDGGHDDRSGSNSGKG